MNTRWRVWLLHLLTLCFFISAVDVKTREIVNTYGDYCEAYLPIKFVVNSIQSATVSAERSLEQIRQTELFTSRVFSPACVVYTSGNQVAVSRFRRIYLRCCQWLI